MAKRFTVVKNDMKQSHKKPWSVVLHGIVDVVQVDKRQNARYICNALNSVVSIQDARTHLNILKAQNDLSDWIDLGGF